ncbi:MULTISPECIES: hypothetical protein [unclassified Streptomyces]|uniref:hypothetical protein n=1 Tax=unclassified Streptomyces TaxID=2593676 RepID=UPI00168B7DDA|nr:MULTISPECIES: hypothetical protein [unclassified Streptomyces]MBD3007280.1 hypothetical protein [Streptomyces sp. 5-10]
MARTLLPPRFRFLLVALLLTTAALAGVSLQAQPAHALQLQPLRSWWSQDRGDNFATGTADQEAMARSAGYRELRTEAWLWPDNGNNTYVELYLFWDPARQDNFSTATRQGVDSAISAGYQYIGVQGYVRGTYAPGTVALYQYWSAERGDNFLTATPAGIRDANAAGYKYVRVEGYVYPYP